MSAAKMQPQGFLQFPNTRECLIFYLPNHPIGSDTNELKKSFKLKCRAAGTGTTPPSTTTFHESFKSLDFNLNYSLEIGAVKLITHSRNLNHGPIERNRPRLSHRPICSIRPQRCRPAPRILQILPFRHPPIAPLNLNPTSAPSQCPLPNPKLKRSPNPRFRRKMYPQRHGFGLFRASEIYRENGD